jgi:uncharacterized membrane protein YdjX (TVP38/TMEM64 family)
VTDYLILFGIVLGVNLMPAFGPPTWSILVLYGLNTDLPLPATVLIGAIAAATGRYLLALAFRLLGERVPRRMRRNLAAAREAFEQRKRASVAALGLFALSPVPSAQLFEAAGLAGVKLLPFTVAFFAGRLVSYTIYAGTARSLREMTFGEAFIDSLTSLPGLAVQLLMIVALIALANIDWARVLKNPRR